jgi:hypothetical protein
MVPHSFQVDLPVGLRTFLGCICNMNLALALPG